MNKIFLSYAYADEPSAQALESALRDQEVTIWRDQQSLCGGQQWPKAIGEALASHDLCLLLWSRNAAASHFVEFEWTTALALRKSILPCLLDDTPLPPALQGIHGIDCKDLHQALPRILGALQGPTPAGAPPAHLSQAISKLGSIGAKEPQQVLGEARTVYAQEVRPVSGSTIIGEINDAKKLSTQRKIKRKPKQEEMRRGHEKKPGMTRRDWVLLAPVAVAIIAVITLYLNTRYVLRPHVSLEPALHQKFEIKGSNSGWMQIEWPFEISNRSNYTARDIIVRVLEAKIEPLSVLERRGARDLPRVMAKEDYLDVEYEKIPLALDQNSRPKTFPFTFNLSHEQARRLYVEAQPNRNSPVISFRYEVSYRGVFGRRSGSSYHYALMVTSRFASSADFQQWLSDKSEKKKEVSWKSALLWSSFTD